jgi:16S rRNA (guanine527-N7)-methyltransferase
MELTEFWTICSANGIIMELEQLHKIERYVRELTYWNDKINLISRKDIDNIFEKHIMHSLSILKYIDIHKKAQCMDIGSGGGLPGIPIAIARPDINMLLVDSIKKKMSVTDMMAKHADCSFLNTFAGRVEDLDKSHYEKYNFIFARGVATIRELISYSKKYLKQKGKYVFLKGGDLTKEIADAKSAWRDLEITVKDIVFFGVESFKKDEKKIVICNFK